MPSINVSVEALSIRCCRCVSKPAGGGAWATSARIRQVKALAEQVLASYEVRPCSLSDVSRDQSLAPRLQVQGLPSIRIIHKGAVAEQIDGPVDEHSFEQ